MSGGKYVLPTLEQAPTFYPSTEEFSDPYSYITSIRGVAEQAGIIKIVPPSTWICPCPISDRGDSFSFHTCVQNIDQLQKRHGACGRFMQGLRRFNQQRKHYSDEFPEIEGTRIDLYRLHQCVHELGGFGKVEVEGKWDVVCSTLFKAQKSSFDTKFHGKISELYKRILEPFVSVASCGGLIDEDNDDEEEEKFVQVRKRFSRMVASSANANEEGEFLEAGETFGFGEGGYYTWNQFKARADKFRQDWFHDWDGPVTVEDVEREYWRVVDGGDLLLRVEYGSDLDVQSHGSGFPTRENSGTDLANYVDSPWNLNNLPVHRHSLLHLISPKGDISGVSSPWMYIGMLFSSFCWHVEDNYLYAINYNHHGAPKTWYGVPADQAVAFETAFQAEVPELWDQDPKLLFKLCTMVSPRALDSRGVRVLHALQCPGEFILTFPRAYHAGFSHGFNCGEAVNFALPDWLPFGRLCLDRYRATRRSAVFSHDRLVLALAHHLPPAGHTAPVPATAHAEPCVGTGDLILSAAPVAGEAEVKVEQSDSTEAGEGGRGDGRSGGGGNGGGAAASYLTPHLAGLVRDELRHLLRREMEERAGLAAPWAAAAAIPVPCFRVPPPSWEAGELEVGLDGAATDTADGVVVVAEGQRVSAGLGWIPRLGDGDVPQCHRCLHHLFVSAAMHAGDPRRLACLRPPCLASLRRRADAAAAAGRADGWGCLLPALLSPAGGGGAGGALVLAYRFSLRELAALAGPAAEDLAGEAARVDALFAPLPAAAAAHHAALRLWFAPAPSGADSPNSTSASPALGPAAPPGLPHGGGGRSAAAREAGGGGGEGRSHARGGRARASGWGAAAGAGGGGRRLAREEQAEGRDVPGYFYFGLAAVTDGLVALEAAAAAEQAAAAAEQAAAAASDGVSSVGAGGGEGVGDRLAAEARRWVDSLPLWAERQLWVLDLGRPVAREGWEWRAEPLLPGLDGAPRPEPAYLPAGFRARRRFASWAEAGAACDYECEVAEGPDGRPRFRVACPGDPAPVERSHPAACWAEVLRRVRRARRRHAAAAAAAAGGGGAGDRGVEGGGGGGGLSRGAAAAAAAAASAGGAGKRQRMG